MNRITLENEDVIHGYKVVSSLYPFIPSLNFWRAFEYAAYQRYSLPGPILDIGCGDGRFFNLIWPDAKKVTGIDIDNNCIEDAKKVGVYDHLLTMSASDLKFPNASFASIFANCALEHMDNIDKVFSEIYRVLQSEGHFLFSVVTDKFIEWTILPKIIRELSGKDKEELSIKEFIDYHHLRNYFPFEEWVSHMERAGFEIVEYIPILAENTSKLFLFVDQVWHVGTSDNNSELGQQIYNYLQKFPNFPNAAIQFLEGCLEMENDSSICSGIVFLVKKSQK